MKFQTIVSASSLGALLCTASTAYSEEQTQEQVAVPAPYNSVVIETDHGQGLGPGGLDLHYGNSDIDPADDDAELFLRSLEEPVQVDDAVAGDAQDGEPEPEDVVSSDHPLANE